MGLALRRVGDSGLAETTYEVPGTGTVTVDSLSYAILVAYDGESIIPTVEVADPGGKIIAAIAGQSDLPFGPPGFNVFQYSAGAVTFFDNDPVQPPAAYIGYVLHDFGPGITLDQFWTIDPVIVNATGNVNVLALRAAGPVVMGANVGETTVKQQATATVTLTGPVAAGSYLGILVTTIDTTPFWLGAPIGAIAVTDSVGGNVLDYDGHLFVTFRLSVFFRREPGHYVDSWWNLYRINNALGVGDTVTVTLTGGDILWLNARCVPITGLTFGNPIGPNPGGNWVAHANLFGNIPFPITLPQPQKTVGPVLFHGGYAVSFLETVEFDNEHGGVYAPQLSGNNEPPGTVSGRLTLPRLTLEPGCTVTVRSLDDDGSLRVADVVSDVKLWLREE